ncbi:hypothetical protein GCM10010909_15940 [Acidocella aquatica]|uniref:Uncharacterized protein n=1 Tax=Acidocella aquatica TaxID=1922313 RepID=A0ABQ6A9W4_9PROT|nr:hypothetical protein GCM10010909_15940 [Acidocella aquatica]
MGISWLVLDGASPAHVGLAIKTGMDAGFAIKGSSWFAFGMSGAGRATFLDAIQSV